MRHKIFAVVAALFLLVGCSTHKPMTAIEMHTAPNFEDNLPEHITVLRLKMNEILDLSDTAFNVDLGAMSSTWSFYLCAPGDETPEQARRFLAVRFPLQDEDVLLVYIPEKLENIKDYKGFVTDHAGKRIFSADASMAHVPGWQKIKVENFPEIIQPVKDMKTIEAQKGSAVYKDLMQLLSPFRKDAEDRWSLASKVRDDYLRAYGVQTGIALDDDQIKQLTQDEDFVEKMKSFLGDNWYGVITFPLWTPEQYGMSILITKVFQIPTKFWSLDVDQPGYMDGKPKRSEVAAMILYQEMKGRKRQ